MLRKLDILPIVLIEKESRIHGNFVAVVTLSTTFFILKKYNVIIAKIANLVIACFWFSNNFPKNVIKHLH